MFDKHEKHKIFSIEMYVRHYNILLNWERQLTNVYRCIMVDLDCEFDKHQVYETYNLLNMRASF